jgi:hypothetical protein
MTVKETIMADEIKEPRFLFWSSQQGGALVCTQTGGNAPRVISKICDQLIDDLLDKGWHLGYWHAILNKNGFRATAYSRELSGSGAPAAQSSYIAINGIRYTSLAKQKAI